jgi:hypothetical protein
LYVEVQCSAAPLYVEALQYAGQHLSLLGYQAAIASLAAEQGGSRRARALHLVALTSHGHFHLHRHRLSMLVLDVCGDGESPVLKLLLCVAASLSNQTATQTSTQLQCSALVISD